MRIDAHGVLLEFSTRLKCHAGKYYYRMIALKIGWGSRRGKIIELAYFLNFAITNVYKEAIE
jgi:hypothetical protein